MDFSQFETREGERDRSGSRCPILEMLRYVSPVVYIRRTATRDTTLGGKTIRAGEKVVKYYGAANRDEFVF
jgi:cytochrome P450